MSTPQQPASNTTGGELNRAAQPSAPANLRLLCCLTDADLSTVQALAGDVGEIEWRPVTIAACVEDLFEAERLALAGQADVVLLDHRLTSGAHPARTIQTVIERLWYAHHTPIPVIGVSHEPQWREVLLATGAADVLDSPLEVNALRMLPVRLQQLVQEARWRSTQKDYRERAARERLLDSVPYQTPWMSHPSNAGAR